MRVPDRILQHVCVALVAVTLPILVPGVLHAATATAARAPLPVSDTGVQVSAAIERHAGPLITERPAQIIKAAAGDTVESLAAEFHIDAATLRWANQLRDVSQPAAGRALTIPPSRGVLVRVVRSEPPSAIASDHGLDPRVILDFNDLRDDTPLAAGTYVQLPQSTVPDGGLDNSIVVPESPGVPMVPSTQTSNGHDNVFPYGQCTYYVATRRHVTWVGNGGQWFDAARAAGRPVGHLPVVGAIAVMYGSWYGHVAYVEKVNADGSFTVSEWNVKGWATYDQRVVSNGPMVIGFIY